MTLIELFLFALALSMDAFAVSICAGLTMPKAKLLKKALIIGLYFGFFQALMPLIGYITAGLFAEYVMIYSHFIAFILLGFIGVKMIIGSLKKSEQCNNTEFSLKPKNMLILAIATSIDALAVGISFALIQINIILAITLIGITTLMLSICGVKIGNVFGTRFKNKAEFIGGTILLLIGLKILLEGLF